MLTYEYILYRKKGTWFMNGTDNNFENTTDDNLEKDKKSTNKIILNICGKEISLSFINFFMVIILPVGLSFVANVLYDNYKSRNVDYLELTNRIESMESTISDISNRLEVVEKNKNGDTIINNTNYYTSKLQPTEKGKIEIIQESQEYACILPRPTWQSNDVIAEDVETGEKYTAEQLVNERILLPYMINGQENYFYGQFNENNQWDGNCIINTYSNDKLVLIMEAEYDNGVLVSYKQVMQGMSKDGKVWCIADRVSHKDYNSGETWNYKYVECLKQFHFEDVSEEDILNVDDFELDIKKTSLLLGYYYGNTSEGEYNDKTDTSYIIKFSDDGYIRTFYKGRFLKGDFNDNTGNAWEIVFDESNNINRYFYYEGKFEKGERAEDKELDYVSQEEIDKIISGMTFDCELNWYSE